MTLSFLPLLRLQTGSSRTNSRINTTAQVVGHPTEKSRHEIFQWPLIRMSWVRTLTKVPYPSQERTSSSMHQTHLEGLLKYTLIDPNPRVSDSTIRGRDGGARICIFNKFSSDADPASSGTKVENLCSRSRLLSPSCH